MTDLDSIRVRADISAKAGKHDALTVEQIASRWHSSAQDVPRLLELIDSLLPLVVAVRNFALGDEDKDALEMLVDAADKMPWKSLDAFGISDKDD